MNWESAKKKGSRSGVATESSEQCCRNVARNQQKQQQQQQRASNQSDHAVASMQQMPVHMSVQFLMIFGEVGNGVVLFREGAKVKKK